MAIFLNRLFERLMSNGKSANKKVIVDPTAQARKTIELFHNLYYNGLPGDNPIYTRTTWMGAPCQKCPLDMWIYQEIISEIKPDLIIETGAYRGGSALFIAHMMDLLDKGEIITIDIDDLPRPQHPRIRYVHGSSSDSGLIHSLLSGRPPETRMVILDSDHAKTHVLKELELLSPYVSKGSYLIIEDTNINGHPTFPAFGDGPWEAVDEFLASNSQFAIDREREKFLITFNPRGYLKREN
jgi:cephalosporin hydroxylase